MSRKCAGVVAGTECLTGRVELRDGGVGDLRGGRRRLRVDRLAVVVGEGGDAHGLRLTADDRLLDDDRLRHGRFGVIGVRVAAVAPVVERRAEGPGRHADRGPGGKPAPSPVVVVVVAVPVAVGPSLVVAPVRASPVVVGGRADPVARVDADPGQVVLADPPDVDVAPIDRVAATDDRPIADARPVADAGPIADARPVVDARPIADAGSVVDARSVADAADATDPPGGYRCQVGCRCRRRPPTPPGGCRCRVGCRCRRLRSRAVVDARSVADAADRRRRAVIDAGSIADAAGPAGRLSMPGRLPMPHRADCRSPGPGRTCRPGGCRPAPLAGDRRRPGRPAGTWRGAPAASTGDPGR